jgi:hypothetical protein
MRIAPAAFLVAAAVVGARYGQAAEFDGSRELICATMEALDCSPGQECLRGLPHDMGAPTFMRIDFERKVVIGPERTSPVTQMETGRGQLLLQGQERGFGWVIAIDQAQGHMTLSLTDRTGAVILFGACTPLQQ